MAVNLCGRDKDGVMERTPGGSAGQTRQGHAGARGDRGVDRMNAVGEGLSQVVEPLAQRAARCAWLEFIFWMLPTISVSDAAERNSEASFASHHCCTGAARGETNKLNRAVSINQVLIKTSIILLEIDVERKGRAEERIAKRRSVGELAFPGDR